MHVCAYGKSPSQNKYSYKFNPAACDSYIPRRELRDLKCLLFDRVLEISEFLRDFRNEELDILRDVLIVDREEILQECKHVHGIRRVLRDFIGDRSDDFFYHRFHC